MINRHDERDALPLQDLDLFSRLSQYFDGIDLQLRAGTGWFIFNASGARAMRISALIATRLRELGPFVSSYLVPWREFALNSYMVGIELQSVAEPDTLEGKAKTEFDIASRVSRDHMVKLVASDLLILTGLQPAHPHELEFLDQAIGRRYDQRLSTILVSPRLPQDLAVSYQQIAPGAPLWDRLFARMYERSLIAL